MSGSLGSIEGSKARSPCRRNPFRKHLIDERLMMKRFNEMRSPALGRAGCLRHERVEVTSEHFLSLARADRSVTGLTESLIQIRHQVFDVFQAHGDANE